jgi:peptidoglycan hydrolase-like protein with peptidoglycan-binding domain
MRSPSHLPAVALLASLAALPAFSGCSSELAEEKARAAAERARDAIQPLDHGALEQKISADVVKKVQTQLTTLKEYMGPITGRLDQVTLNALESFQRKNDITPDGRFNDETLRLLDSTASRKS